MNSVRKRVVVIGGGISGLAAAHRLVELDPTIDVTLLEASPRVGGVIETARRDGYLIERSADNFITNVPWAVDLCRRVGMADQLIQTTSQKRNAMVVHKGRLVGVPAGFMLLAPSRLWPLLTTPLLSPWGKLRLLSESFVPRRKSTDDESLESFATRRLGREAFERIVQPLVGGIYAADPKQLSLQATMPRFVEMERRHGSLIRAARSADAKENASREESGARYGLFATLRDGLSSLVDALVARLPKESVRLSSPVERICRDGGAPWTVQVAGNSGEPDAICCDAVIVTVGAPAAARMLADVDSRLATDLGQIDYSGTSIVMLAFRRDQIAHALDGFGFVVPACEKRRILAGSFSSVKFAGRAPGEMVLVRVFIGGACQSELADLPDEALLQIATEELRELLGTSGEPAIADVARWPRSMPQYHLGHCELVASIETAVSRLRGLALAGNAYHGVGIPACIHSGETAAEQVMASLANPPAAHSEATMQDPTGETAT